MIHCAELIVSDLALRGSGKNELSPCRRVVEVYNKAGELIGELDPMGNFTVEQLAEFGYFCRENPNFSLPEAFQNWAAGRSFPRGLPVPAGNMIP